MTDYPIVRLPQDHLERTAEVRWLQDVIAILVGRLGERQTITEDDWAELDERRQRLEIEESEGNTVLELVK